MRSPHAAWRRPVRTHRRRPWPGRPAVAAVIARRLRLGQRGARAHGTAVHLRRGHRRLFEAPAQPLQQALRAIHGRGRRPQHGHQQQGHADQPAAHAHPWSVLAGAGSGVAGTGEAGGAGVAASAGRYCCRRWKKRR
ncbi:hypothetical protein G6F35_016339 [Rhizopus arrhizus]|nr:hypothetical protein G6F35_016339 [Rhizopus arrhizus]